MAAQYIAYVGTYTWDDSEGIYAFRVDGDDIDFEPLGATPAGENPSFLAIHPSGDYLYAINESDPGTITAFAIDDETGDLEQLSQAETGAPGPCHCSVDATGSYVLVAHYGGKSVSALPIENGDVSDATQVIEHEGSSVDPDRQTQPRPHSIVPGPNNRFVYAPDLGTDRVFIYAFDPNNGPLTPSEQGSVQLQERAGPRHFDFHPDGDRAFLINEMDSTLTAFDRNQDTGALSEITTVSTLPADFDGENSTADVHVHPSGNWVYGSNRGHDSIAIFDIDDDTGELDVLGHESTRGETPRNFAIDPTGAFLVAENQDTDDMHAYEIQADGRLEYVKEVAEVSRPVCLKFLEV